MSEAKIWKSGLPYEPQSQKLKDAYPLPEEGMLISHDDLEKLVNEKVQTQRYYGICNSWRRYLFNSLGIDTAWIPGDGIKVLSPAERLKAGETDYHVGARKTKRGVRRTAATPRDRLDTIGQQRFDHDMIVMSRTVASLNQDRKELAVELAPVKSLPRPKIVDKKVS